VSVRRAEARGRCAPEAARRVAGVGPDRRSARRRLGGRWAGGTLGGGLVCVHSPPPVALGAAVPLPQA